MIEKETDQIYILLRQGNSVSKAVWPKNHTVFPQKETFSPDTQLPDTLQNKETSEKFRPLQIMGDHPEISLLFIGFLMTMGLYIQAWFLTVPSAILFICVLLFIGQRIYANIPDRHTPVTDYPKTITRVQNNAGDRNVLPKIPATEIPVESIKIRALETINLAESSIQHFIQETSTIEPL